MFHVPLADMNSTNQSFIESDMNVAWKRPTQAPTGTFRCEDCVEAPCVLRMGYFTSIASKSKRTVRLCSGVMMNFHIQDR